MAAIVRESARAAGRVPRVSGRAEHIVEGVRAGRELGSVGLAEDDRPRIAEPADDERILARYMIRVQRRAVGRADLRDGGDVLDPHRKSMQRPRGFAAACARLERTRLVQRSIVQGDDRVQHAVVSIHTLETRLGRLHRRQFATGDEPRELNGREVRNLGAGHGTIACRQLHRGCSSSSRPRCACVIESPASSPASLNPREKRRPGRTPLHPL